MKTFPAIGHVAITVKDLEVSRPWYRRLVDADPVLDEATESGFHHTVFLVGDTLLGLHEHPAAQTETPFTELRTGLDHIAFSCSDRAELDTWGGRLDDLGVSHSEIVDAPYGSGLSFRDPDGIALEFFAPPA